MNYLVTLDRIHCIGCADCPKACPKLFRMDNDGKAVIKKAKKQDLQQRKITKTDLECAMRGARVCPVDVIHIKKKADLK